MVENLRIKNVHKSFGKTRVLKNINLNIQGNSCYCLIGKNGAGKSTLLNIISDLILPDKGDIYIFGETYKSNHLLIKKSIGVLPEHLPLINELTGEQYLRLLSTIYGISEKEYLSRKESLIEYFFGNDKILDQKIVSYSKGTKLKYAFCTILIHSPKILILDEPFNGWDPISVNLLIDFLNSFLNEDTSILLSSHDLLYIDKVATHIGLLDENELKFSSSIDEFKTIGEGDIMSALYKVLSINEKNLSGLEWIIHQ